MRRALVALLPLLALLAPAVPADAGIDPRQVRGSLTRMWTGLQDPVAFDHVPGETARSFIVERPGRIRVIRNGVLKATPFLDLTSKASTAGEGGMLSVAFRPDYRTSGLFFVAWTDVHNRIRVTKFHAHPTSDRANPLGADVLTIPHPGYTNHYGGQLAFGPGGLLYVGTGDGGGSGDPNGNAQNLSSLLGKILRIDVYRTSPGLPYAIPSGNPYATSTTARREIWHVGLRNPWRFSFERGNPRLWVADVGQGAREEVNRTTTGGLNLGWDCREGTLTTTYGGSYCKTTGYTAPIFEYETRTYGCAVIGGYVYQGAKYSTLLGGSYVFGDYCSGRLWALGPDSTGKLVAGELGRFGGNILAFGRDASGELYLLAASGYVYRIGASRR